MQKQPFRIQIKIEVEKCVKVMIAIDTNVLLRYQLDDDAKQSPKATNLLSGSEDVLITDVVITETVWTLKGKRYNLKKEQIIDVLIVNKAKKHGLSNGNEVSVIYTFDTAALAIPGTKNPAESG